MPKARRSRFNSDHDLLVVLVTNQEWVAKTMASMQRTQQNIVGATKALVQQVRDLTAQVNVANGWLSGINAKLGIKILNDIEKSNVPHINASEQPSTVSSDQSQPPKQPEDKAATERKKHLAQLTDWVTGLTLVRKILYLVPPLLIGIAFIIFTAWKVLAWLKPGRIPPPPNPPMVLPK